jgi:hypothetical protein
MVYITPDEYSKLLAYVLIAEGEIYGRFLATIDKEGDITVKRILPLVKQTASAGSVDLDAVDAALQLQEVIKEGEIDNYIGMWHSHGKMKVAWSADDIKSITNLIHQRPIAVNLVLNKFGDSLARVDVIVKGIHFTETTDLIQLPFPFDIEEAIKEVKEKVIKRAVVVIQKPNNIYHPKPWYQEAEETSTKVWTSPAIHALQDMSEEEIEALLESI